VLGLRLEWFPRTDPVVIMHGHGRLVACWRTSIATAQMFSALAGSFEPGEISSTPCAARCRGDRHQVGEVKLPLEPAVALPPSLMLGCIGPAETTDLSDRHHRDRRGYGLPPGRAADAGAPAPRRLDRAGKQAIANTLIASFVDAASVLIREIRLHLRQIERISRSEGHEPS